MALTKFALTRLRAHLRGAHVLALGYPDLLMTPAEAGAILGVELKRESPYGDRHKLKHTIADTVEAFQAVGARVTYADLFPSRGEEIVVDLNHETDLGLFDLVIDAGTIEHCANIGQALMNCAKAVRPGGVVFHSPPFSMANHGFYNVNPTLLWDFYAQNGWEILHLSAFSAHHPYAGADIERQKRFKMQNDLALYFLARRMLGDDLRWPTQSKYLK